MHALVALWSHPRSMSTAMERVMRERGDFRCHHEPFMYYYYVGLGVREMPHFDVDPAHPTSYEGVRDMLVDAAREGPVFFKDMSYYVLERLQGDPGFARRVTHTFLIRDPARAIRSYAKLDPALTSVEVGIEAQWRMFRWLEDALGIAPVVIAAEDVQADAGGMMRAYAHAIGVEFRPEALAWREEAPAEWRAVESWHGDVLGARGIRAAPPAPADPRELLGGDPRLLELYEHHRPFYDALRERRLVNSPGPPTAGA